MRPVLIVASMEPKLQDCMESRAPNTVEAILQDSTQPF